jgi:predicted transcriptional regulator
MAQASDKQKKKVSGVALDPDVIEYLDQLAAQQDRSRSWIVNALAKEHARLNGKELGQLQAG